MTEKHWKQIIPWSTPSENCIIRGIVSSYIYNYGHDPVIQLVFCPTGLKSKQFCNTHLHIGYSFTFFLEEIETTGTPSAEFISSWQKLSRVPFIFSSISQDLDRSKVWIYTTKMTKICEFCSYYWYNKQVSEPATWMLELQMSWLLLRSIQKFMLYEHVKFTPGAFIKSNSNHHSSYSQWIVFVGRHTEALCVVFHLTVVSSCISAHLIKHAWINHSIQLHPGPLFRL